VFLHIAPALKRFALRSQEGPPRNYDFSWSFAAEPPPEPSKIEKRGDWAINCKGLNEAHLQLDFSQVDIVPRMIAQCPELHDVMITPKHASSSFQHQEPMIGAIELPEGNQVHNLNLANIVLNLQSRIQGENIATLNLRDCDLSLIYHQYRSSAASAGTTAPRQSDFFECIRRGCPSLRKLLFVWKSLDHQAIDYALSGSILPVLAFPNLETLAITAQGVTNADLLQIATNCHNLRELAIQPDSGYYSHYFHFGLEVQEVDAKQAGQVSEAGIFLPNLEHLHLQAVICTDSVLDVLVKSAPKLLVMVRHFISMLTSFFISKNAFNSNIHRLPRNVRPCPNRRSSILGTRLCY
jgi:hypothetical protein